MLGCVLLQTSSLQGVFCVDFCPVVTNVVNLRAFSLKMAVFGLRLTTFVTEALERRRESRWFDDVCNIGRPLVARPGPVPRSVPYPQFCMQFPDTCSSSLSEKPGISTITFQSMKCTRGNCMRICADQAPPPPMGAAAWPCRPGVRLSETAIAFAHSCSCGIETPVAFAGVGRA